MTRRRKASKFEPVDETAELTWASEHKIGIASDLSDDMKEFLRAEFAGECSEVGMYLAMSRAAIRQGYPEVGAFYRQAAFEEADHASRYAEMLGEVVSASTKENLEARVAAENGACAGKTAFAKKCKEMGLDALHDSIHEMARDEAAGSFILGQIVRVNSIKPCRWNQERSRSCERPYP